MGKSEIVLNVLSTILLILSLFFACWAIKHQKKKFKEYIQDTVVEELDKKEKTLYAQTKEPSRGSDAHYEAWRAEQLAKKDGKE